LEPQISIDGNCTLKRFNNNIDLSSFTCGNSDLDDFIKSDAAKYMDNLYAVTYLFIHNENEKIVAFFSVSNDNLRDDGFDKNIWRHFQKKIPHLKRRRNYPAVLLGRLGVCSEYARNGIGTEVLNFIKGWFRFENKTGCRFILVDAYNIDKVTEFYTKNGFSFLVEKDQSDDTRFMFFDLAKFSA
jgi:GNAT superfamily N-acetyltransferase